MTNWSELPLTEQHATYLRDQAAITAEVAKAKGLRSITTLDELPEWAQWAGEKALPAIVFPWIRIDGTVIEQIRPDAEFEHNGSAYKYLFPKGAGAVLNALRHDLDVDTVLIVEGTKQGLAAASWAPKDVAVYGVGGCRNWSTDGIPDADLEVCDSRHVVIALDADVSSNRDVYDAAVKLGQAAKAEGATRVSYLRLPAAGTNGLDDVLAKKREDRRSAFIANLIEQSHPTKPCDARPKPKPKGKTLPGSTAVALSATGEERKVVFVDRDRKLVIDDLTAELVARWDATRLFHHGKAIAQVTPGRRLGQDVMTLSPLSKGAFLKLLQDTVATAKPVTNGEGEQVGVSYTWPDGQTVEAILSDPDQFTPLERIARTPFLRKDGTICQTNGYDEASRTLLVMDEEMQRIRVPEDPTAEEMAAAVRFIVDEWLGDIMKSLPDPADRANAIALLATPFVRGLMEVVPLAVVDGLQMGVGKNLFADMLAITATGDAVEPMPWSQEDEENRKVITSTFREGADVFVFDEAHLLHGASLARALTSATWKDRQLGVSQMLEFPNQVTWVSLGNKVRVEGDITRRVYRIAIHPKTRNPQDRKASEFRHPDLRGWTKANRVQIVQALLTVVRSWFAAGQPAGAREVSFGSFEKWERIVGGILHHAGIEGFLTNLQEWRSETSFETRYWTAHVEWLLRTFGSGTEFTCAQVRDALMRDQHSETPPGMTDLSGEDSRSYNRKLGQAYARHADRWFGDIQLIKAGGKHGHVVAWMVLETEDGDQGAEATPEPTPEGVGGIGGDPTPYAHTAEKNFSMRGARDVEKRVLREGVRAAGVTPVTPVPSMEASEHPWDGVIQPSLFADLEETVAPVTPVPTQRPAPLPTPPVKDSTVLPADWFSLFAMDAPALPRPSCETCGATKVPDSDMRYFLLCPTCTPGTLRPPTLEAIR